jgi:hypothetical protein
MIIINHGNLSECNKRLPACGHDAKVGGKEL